MVLRWFNGYGDKIPFACAAITASGIVLCRALPFNNLRERWPEGVPGSAQVDRVLKIGSLGNGGLTLPALQRAEAGHPNMRITCLRRFSISSRVILRS